VAAKIDSDTFDSMYFYIGELWAQFASFCFVEMGEFF